MNEFNFFDSLFNDLMGANTNKPAYTCSYATPKVDIREEKNCYILDMELPGKTENDVNIELDHDVISISSKKRSTSSAPVICIGINCIHLWTSVP